MPIDTKMPSQFPFIPTFMLIRRISLPALSALMIAPAAIAQTAPTSSAADLLPTDTAGVLLINTDENTWQGLSRFGLFPADFSFPGNFYPIQAGLTFIPIFSPGWEIRSRSRFSLSNRVPIGRSLLRPLKTRR